MIYILILAASVGGIALLFTFRVLLRNRGVRRFVRSIKQRLQASEDRNVQLLEERKLERPQRMSRASAGEMQQVRMLVRQAEKEIAQRHLEEAERLYIQALTIQPQALDVQAELAKLYLTSDRENKAEALYKELIPQRDDVSFHANLGLAYYRQGKYEEACTAYQDALTREPHVPERMATLGRTCIAAKHFDQAADLLEKASARLSRDTELLHLLAECYLQLGNTEKAEETYRRIHKIEPYNETVKAKLSSLATHA